MSISCLQTTSAGRRGREPDPSEARGQARDRALQRFPCTGPYGDDARAQIDWPRMAPDSEYDVVVLGGGPAGYAFALRGALLGLKIAIVERDKVGGTCLHRGCIPTKALLHAAEVMDAINDAGGVGIKVADPSFDWAEVQRSKAEPVKKLYAGLQSVIKARKVDTFSGIGTLGD